MSAEVTAAVLLACFAAALLSVLASFAAVVVSRSRLGESPWSGRSHCVCGEPIPAYLNVPLVSWLLLRGRAKCCGSAIPASFFLAELAAAVLGAGLALLAGPAGIAVAVLVLAAITAVAAITARGRSAGVSRAGDHRDA